MPVERRNLRSRKDSNSSSGDKAAKEKPSSSRVPPAKSKAAPAKKAASSAKDGKDKSKANGAAPVKRSATGSKDAGMAKDGDEEMTVVVPPPNSSKLSGEPAKEDAEMGDADAETVDPTASLVADIKANFVLLEKAVQQFDARFSLRVLRSISSSRKHLTAARLAEVITDTYAASSPVAQLLLQAIGQQHTSFARHDEMETETSRPSSKTASKDILPEVDTYLGILTQVFFWDTKAFEQGAEFSTSLVGRLRTLNRRTLDPLAAKVYFYYTLFYEQLAPLPPSASSPVISIRPALLAALRTAVLRKDQDTQATVTTLLLRNYLSTSHINQADLLIEHSQFPPAASNNQIARYLYYLGRIRAIQLSYTEAHERLVGATRKSPSSHSAGGFYQASMKLLIIVELLMGDIPDRATFRQPGLERALQPYLQLVQAVRVGDLEKFVSIVKANHATFRKDGTYTLILRLRQNVIKTGIRMMSLSYARISLRDICVRLGLPSEETAEYIVAKAIRDDVIEATLDHENGYMKSKEAGDVYATREPGEAFHDRIRACLDLHDESVKAMRFPMNQHRLELKNAQEARERERELAKEIVEGEMDDDDAGGDFDGMSSERHAPNMIPPATRLRRAIHYNDAVLVARIVHSHPSALENPDFDDLSNTSLHLAASLGHRAIAAVLIDAGHDAEVVSRNTAGATPLMLAISGGHESTAALLLAAFPRSIPRRDAQGRDALMLAARAGLPDVLSRLLATAPDPASLLAATDAEGNAALHFASAFGHLKCVMLLLQAGAPPDRENARSWEAVHYSSTVSAEVFFKNAVLEMERRRSMERRGGTGASGAGGVRVVDADTDEESEEDWGDGSEASRMPSSSSGPAEQGRETPSSLRAPSRGLPGRVRAESLE